ncbi:MAG TPA: hypothetical protein DEO84_07620 [candidate division Zixibacteria bacterium]|jgi:hypothetical protein|nr:hypothetical protein [candidate division Zixibacteria bacterium]
MLTEMREPDKISLGYRIFFEGTKEIFLRYSISKIFQITLLVLLSIFISVSIAHAGWSEPRRISKPAAFLYPQILAHGDTIHVVFMHWSNGRDIGYVRSTDAGETWSQEIGLTDTIHTHAPAFPQIMAWGQNLLVVWKIYFDNGFYLMNIGYSISHNNGQNWSAPAYIMPSNWEMVDQIAASNNDSVVNVIFASYPRTTLYQIRSTDFGEHWSSPAEILLADYVSKPDQNSALNMVYFSWDGPINPNDMWETYCLKSTDRGLSWSDNMLISTQDNYPSQLPSVAVNEFGNPAISWWDFKYSPYQFTGDILFRQSTNQGESWGFEERVTTNHLCDLSDIFWSDDTLRAVWVDHRFGINGLTIYYAFKADSSQYWSPEVRLEDDPAESSYPAIAVTEGNVYIVWCDTRSNPDTNINGAVYFTKRVQGPDRINVESALPEEVSLSAYPNPFNSSVTISHSNLGRGGDIAIYDIQGRLIKTFRPEGKEGKIIWDATTALGNKVSSGEYLLKARSASHKTYSLKLLYLK